MVKVHSGQFRSIPMIVRLLGWIDCSSCGWYWVAHSTLDQVIRVQFQVCTFSLIGSGSRCSIKDSIQRALTL